jgi:hypothetical protein
MNNTNTMNTKNYAIVANNGLSVLVNQEGQYKSYTAENNLLASLKALQAILNQIPTNEEMAPGVTKVIIGSKSSIKGFVCGSHLTYIRTGKNVQGKAFSAEELQLIKTCATMLSNRSLNVWLTTDEWVGKNSAEFKLFQNAWTVQKQELKSQAASQASQPQANPQNAKALMDEIAQLKAQLEALIGAQSQAAVEQSVVEDPDDLLE